MPRTERPSACSPSQIAPANIMLRVPSFIAGAIVAAETDGLTTLPANLAKRLAGPLGLAAFETPIALPRIEIAQYWHERYHRDRRASLVQIGNLRTVRRNREQARADHRIKLISIN